ncbi:hypothetical protein G9A89_017236 [Geosiphon pyriformis]|nr:hypothetical protein G9A89_017236 [Geosiphon pyriformis]
MEREHDLKDDLPRSLITPKTRIRVSSVLNRDITTYGKQHLIDQSHETCWNSDQGSPQYIIIDFQRKVKLQELLIMFQGGFAGKKCHILGANHNDGYQYELITSIFPEDINTLQISFNVLL